MQCTYCKEKITGDNETLKVIHWECAIVETLFDLINKGKLQDTNPKE